MFVLLSTTSTSEVTYGEPSKVTVNENFKDPVLLPPGYPKIPSSINNFVHQGTNFFFNPQFLLGSHVIPPIGAVVASIKSDNKNKGLIEENIKMPIEEDKTLAVNVTEDKDKSIKVTINEKYDPPPITVSPIPATESTVDVEIKNIVPIGSMIEDNIEEIVEPHDIIMINKDPQPLIKPKLIVTEQLLTVPEAPVLPPLVLPEPPIKVKIEESIPFSLPIPSMSESQLYISLNPNVPLLIESNDYHPLITEIDYKLNKIPLAPELPPLLLNKFPQLIHTYKN